MSWEANVWAIKQRMKLPQEQLVLIVLGNCADPDAVAFSKWPGRDHWWKYLSKITRLSRSSLFRHINTIVALGLAERSMIVLSDGSKRPTITLKLESSFDIETERDRYLDATQGASRDESHSETPEETEVDEAETINESKALAEENDDATDESHHETETPLSPTSGNEPVPPAGLHIDSSKSYSKESPPTPSGGFANDDLWSEFLKAWGEPIQLLALTRTAWERTATDKRARCIAAAKGFWAWHRAQKKPKTPQSAKSFIRDEAGWAQWLPYVPDASGVVSLNRTYPLTSPEGQAIKTLFDVAGKSDAFRTIYLRGDVVYYAKPITPKLLALAGVPARSEWGTLTRQQAGAWESFLREILGDMLRRPLKEGDPAPHPWPPKVDGTWSPREGPTELMTEQDYAEFT